MIDIVDLVPWLLTLFIFSVIYKENRFFRIAEHVAIGATSGQLVLAGIEYVRNSGIKPLLSLDFRTLSFVPLLLGIGVFAVFSKRYSWVSRYPSSLMMGIGLGISVRGMIKANLTNQILSLIMLPETITLSVVLTYILGIVIGITGLLYFTYTREHTGWLGKFAKVGRYFILAGLGIGYVNFMLGRFAVFIPRLTYLIETFMSFF